MKARSIPVTVDTVYFAIVSDSYTSSPIGLARRRFGAGGITDEAWTRTASWTPTNVVKRFYLKPDPDDEVVMITESEASALSEWLQHQTGSPPFPGGHRVEAWTLTLIGAPATRELLTRLRLDEHGSATDYDSTLGFRVLQTDAFGRASLNLYQFRSHAWVVRIERLGAAPSPTLIEQIRAETLAAIIDLPVSVVSERHMGTYIGRWNEPRGRATATYLDVILQITARGALTGDAISELRRRLQLADDEHDVDANTGHGQRRGSTRYIDNGNHRAALRFEPMGTDRWLFLLLATRSRFTEADLRQWQGNLNTAASKAGLIIESTWKSGAVAPET